MTTSTPSWSFRDATVGDAEPVRAIFNYEVEHSTAVLELEPRSLEAQQAWLADRAGAHCVIVAETDGEVVGFASLSPFRARSAYRTTVENSVYVSRHHRGQGLGAALLDEIVGAAREHGFHAVMARIAGDNDGSIRLHERAGFNLVGVEREVGRKFGRWIDIAEMQLLLA